MHHWSLKHLIHAESIRRPGAEPPAPLHRLCFHWSLRVCARSGSTRHFVGQQFAFGEEKQQRYDWNIKIKEKLPLNKNDSQTACFYVQVIPNEQITAGQRLKHAWFRLIKALLTSPTSYTRTCPSESPTAISLPEGAHLTLLRAGLPSTVTLAVGTLTVKSNSNNH